MSHSSLASAGMESDAPAAQPLAALCVGVLPVWARHLATSRAQSEAAVSQMLGAFAHIAPHIGLAQRQAQQITQALHPADSDPGTATLGLAQACEKALAPLMANPQLRALAAPAVAQALSLVHHAVDALQAVAQPALDQAHALAPHVEQMYLGFQYQDRTSQMMALLEQDMARLQAAVATQGTGEATALTLAQWLARLESQYAMAEQHHEHAGVSLQPGAPGTSGNDETTFF